MPTSPSAMLQRGEKRSPLTSEDHACSLSARAFGRANSFSIAKVALQVAAIAFVTGAAAATDTVSATLTDRQGSTASGSLDPSRPGYHYTRPLGWQNDPVPFQGLDGTHHLFTLCDPNATTQWSLPSDHTAWCHATSSGVQAPSRPDSTQRPGVTQTRRRAKMSRVASRAWPGLPVVHHWPAFSRVGHITCMHSCISSAAAMYARCMAVQCSVHHWPAFSRVGHMYHLRVCLYLSHRLPPYMHTGHAVIFTIHRPNHVHRPFVMANAQARADDWTMARRAWRRWDRERGRPSEG
jgi:hypothetical protein